MKMKLILCVGLIAVLASLLFFWRIDEEANAHSKKTFVLDVDLDKFRQILVRTDATASMVEHGGMKLTHESVQAVEIDLTNERHPLRNVLTGNSKAEVAASKRLTVELTDSMLDAHEIALQQDTQIQPNKIHVHTESIRPAGKLRTYVTNLEAVRDHEKTHITISVNLSVDLHISPFLSRIARSRVRNAAIGALDEQEAALRDLVSQFSGKSIILPTLGS